MVKTRPPTLQETIVANTRRMDALLFRLPIPEKTDDWRPAPIPGWLIELRKERQQEPAITRETTFKPFLWTRWDGERMQVLCECHSKPMLLARTNGDWGYICTISAFLQLAKVGCAVESPASLYKKFCNGKAK